MKILAFDTSTKFLSIALLEGEYLISFYHKDAGIRHSELLVPTMKEMLERMGWKPSEIELIAVGLGPGSFTGMRIGIATVKGLATMLGSRVIGVPSMDAMIRNIKTPPRLIAPILDARKEKVYTCIYEYANGAFRKKTDYMLTFIDDLLDALEEKVLFFGDAIGKYREKLSGSPMADHDENVDWYPRATELGRIGYERAMLGTDDPGEINPLYLHAKECSIG
jgi:tRNA threonylcarbamoyladenosine biosynthesis protein TsaB